MVPLSVHEITLSEREHLRWLAGKKPTIRPHFVGFWIDLHTRRRVVQHHGTLANVAGIRDRKKLFCKSKLLSFRHQSLADECDRAFCHAAAERTKHWAVILR